MFFPFHVVSDLRSEVPFRQGVLYTIMGVTFTFDVKQISGNLLFYFTFGSRFQKLSSWFENFVRDMYLAIYIRNEGVH